MSQFGLNKKVRKEFQEILLMKYYSLRKVRKIPILNKVNLILMVLLKSKKIKFINFH
jgi:hypothetical protein